MVRSIRWSTRLGVATLAVVMLAGSAFAAAVWGNAPGAANGRVGANYTWNDGPPMAAKLGSKLIAVYDSDYIGCGATTDGSGCFMGAYATTSGNSGGTWATPRRLNPGTIHGERATIAAGTTKACAAYMTQTKYYSTNYITYTFDKNAVRTTYVRCTSDGSTWLAAIKLPGQTNTSRGDYPYMAASGSNFYLTMTNSQNGNIALWKSTNSGGTWTGPVTIGTTTLVDNASDGYVGGFTALPAVAAAGANVVVAWQTTGGAAHYKVSADSGVTWGTDKTLDSGATNANYGFVNLRGSADGRIAAGWSTATAAKVALLSGATFGTTRTVASFPDAQAGVSSAAHQAGFDVVPVLGSGTTLGVTWTECNTIIASGSDYCADNYPETGQYAKTIRMAQVYRQSANNGTSFGAASVVAEPNTKFTENDWADALFVGSSPYVFYSSHNAPYKYYNIQLRVCTGC
jgi:hypothetical protein